jgi:hypothetical protein
MKPSPPSVEELTDRLKEARQVSTAVVRELEAVMRLAARRMKIEARVRIPRFQDEGEKKLFLCIRNDSTTGRGAMWGLWVGPYERRGYIRLSRNPDVYEATYRYYKPQWYDVEDRDVILAQLPELIRVWKRNIERELKKLGKSNRRISTMTRHAKKLSAELLDT